ncbi:UDP-4-amino-4,6-dideoxy-N-acetyl-beta-L-altrosamine transaminase [Paraglaciecola sp.]|uniref:UDP-4-amino-4, 6-dideoxy-N-acetyl-beta-L-altrosamine transaminase n=1 Tax=Paraglaciecola sp. TaxID=1920173 RepID=UPI0030F462D6
MIPYGLHTIDDADVESVIDVLRNQFLTQGTVVPQFEQALCVYTGAKHAVAVNSATSGLHIACLAAGVGQGDIVWTVPNSFVASANCARFCGADVDFVDINAVTRNIDVTALAEKLQIAAKHNKLPKALIVVHFAGLSCDMLNIHKLTSTYHIVLIEDAAHALGGDYLGRKIGCCQYSAMTVLSFHPVKSITTAEGGAVLTNNSAYFTKLQLFAKHGVTRDPALMQGESDGPWYYQQVELGYNYRLSDLHAALGITQLQKLEQFIAKRRLLAQCYKQKLAELPLSLPCNESYEHSAWHLYMVELTQHDRLNTYQRLHQLGIGVNVHYIPIHLQPYYQALGFKLGDFPVAEQFYQHALTLPLFPSMTEDEQRKVITVLHEVLLEARA